MKKLLLALALTLPFTVQSQTQDEALKSTCNTLYNLSVTMMKSRQEGIPYHSIYDLYEEYGDSTTGIWGRSALKTAYETPLYEHPETKKLAGESFALGNYIWCMENIMDMVSKHGTKIE